MKLPLSDEIVPPFNRGDPEAFNRVFQELYPVVYLLVSKLVHSSPAARDITTDAFVRLWEHRGEFKRKRLISLKSFLLKTAKNLGRDYLRHRLTEKKKLLEIQKLEQSLQAESIQPEEVHAEILDQINQAIEYLPHQCRRVFLLAFTENLSNTEIANHLHISVKTVFNQKGIALKMLKIKLTKMSGISIPVLFAVSCHFNPPLHFFQCMI